LTEEIKNGEIPLNLLTKKIKEAKALIEFCQTSLAKVDNDVNETAKSVVETYKQKSSFNIQYFVEPEQNISLARNKAVKNAKGNFIALIDDDEYPGPTWLLNFYKVLEEVKADGVLGPVVPHYPAGIPKWIIKSKIWEMNFRKTGTILNWPETRTSNVFLNGSIFHGQVQPFDPQFGLTGGEDQDFFKRMMKRGHQFVWCDEAIVYETVPQERWKKKFYIKKYLQMGGQTGLLARKWSLAGKCKWLVKSFFATGSYTFVLPFSCLFGQHIFMRCILKGLYFVGWLAGFLWRPIIRNRY